MPHILVIHTETDTISDHVEIGEEELPSTVESLYNKLTDTYSIEILYDTSDRPEISDY